MRSTSWLQKHPRHLLHGHAPLTRTFASPSMLVQLKSALAWLREQVLAAVQRGDERASIHHANLIPPGLLPGDCSTRWSLSTGRLGLQA
jgi:hypothetical protein